MDEAHPSPETNPSRGTAAPACVPLAQAVEAFERGDFVECRRATRALAAPADGADRWAPADEEVLIRLRRALRFDPALIVVAVACLVIWGYLVGSVALR